MTSTITLKDLVEYCQTFLGADSFQDYAPNGLQVEGRASISRLMTGVTASQALIESAIQWGADALLVHHGYFWRNEPSVIIGYKARRIRLLLENQLSLIAYHLPLDAHPVIGNNAQLAVKLGLQFEGTIPDGTKNSLVCYGGLSPLTGQELQAHIMTCLGREPLHIPGKAEKISRIAWCTGAAQQAVQLAAEQGFDAYITGEVSESTVHIAREMGIHFYAAGHHATERYGVMALGAHLAEKFGIEHQFQDIHNPV